VVGRDHARDVEYDPLDLPEDFVSAIPLGEEYHIVGELRCLDLGLCWVLVAIVIVAGSQKR
jgi:hypothetical protein